MPSRFLIAMADQAAPIVCMLSLVLLTAVACSSPSAPPPEVVTVSRPLGTWQGRGNHTIGLVSDSGRLRISWQTLREDPVQPGTFRLTVHSAVSGRPIQVVTDQRGVGRGTADFADDPRSYNLMVESANVDWSITVDEVSAAYASPPSSASPRR